MACGQFASAKQGNSEEVPFRCETSLQNQGMRRFMERPHKPYSLWTDSRYLSEKRLAAACGGADRRE